MKEILKDKRMKKNIVFDFFNPKECINSLIKHFNLEKKAVHNYLENYGCLDNYTKIKIDFIKEFKIDLPSVDIKSTKIKCKHLTTSFDNLESIKRYGLLPLNKVLQLDTTLNRFLKENEIEINVEEKTLKYKNIIIELHDYNEDCRVCYYQNCKYERKDYFNNIDISYKNINCEHRANLRFLNLKLYNDKCEIEVHISGTKEKITNYSCIKSCPEILHTINETIKNVFREDNLLCDKWSRNVNKEVYIAEFDLSLDKFEYLTNGRFFSKPYEFQKYSDACELKIDWDDIDWDDIRLNTKAINFFSNIFLINKSLDSYYNSSFNSYAQLLPDVSVSEELISFTKI